jgi:hypothetical protein
MIYSTTLINPAKSIDFIVYAPKEMFKVVQYSVIAETYASDHRPVMATSIAINQFHFDRFVFVL